jgi:NAD(P)-dependent dehydrogenase (short-subunit alcohol dehydrogenase family)
MTVLDAFRLDGCRAVVTGAGRGLGLVTARALAQAGADVALLGRDRARLEDAAKAIEKETGRQTLALVADVTDVTGVRAAMVEARDTFGPPNVLVNNAGIERESMLVDMDPADWTDVLATNVGGLFACTQAFLKVLADGPASIINIASIGTAAGFAGQSPYCASKGAVASATRALAVELARRKIRVNAIAPGYLATDMPAAITEDPERLQRLLSHIPLRRLGEPEEIGPLMVYLASPASSFMTGAILSLDGGYTAI